MHEVRNPAGRLVTFRVVPPISDENGANASIDLRSAVVARPGTVVVISDLSAARTFSPQTTNRFIELMKSDNPRIEKSALLLPPGEATLALQVARMVTEAAHPARRTFTVASELRAWVDPVLTDEERLALAAFLP